MTSEIEHDPSQAAALEFTHELTLRACGVQTSTVYGKPDELMVTAMGLPEFVKLDPPRRLHKLQTLPALVEAATNAEVCPNPEVWVGRRRAIVYPDRADRLSALVLDYGTSAPFLTMQEMECEARSFSVKECARFLRFELPGAAPQEVLKALSRLDFKRTDSGSAHAKHGAEGYGRAIEMEAQQADAVPETFTAVVVAHLAPGVDAQSQVQVEVGVFLDVENGEVELRVLPDECRVALDSAADRVAAKLVDLLPATCPVFRGEAFQGELPTHV